MRKSYSPAMLFNSKNKLFCIATGTDATSEHEHGIDELMLETTGTTPLKAEEIGAQIKSGALKTIPQILDGRTILGGNESIVFEERIGFGEPEAVLAFNSRRLVRPYDDVYLNAQLNFPSTDGSPKDIAAAWDSGGFAFKVRGAQKVAQLREFATAMNEGKVAFGGKFMTTTEALLMSGIILVRMDLLRPEHRSGMQQAQAEFEANVLLHSKARTHELRKLCYELKNKSITHLWPVWEDRIVGGNVAYAINPGYNVDAQYWGPYGFDQLKDWLEAGAVTPLRPLEKVKLETQAA